MPNQGRSGACSRGLSSVALGVVAVLLLPAGSVHAEELIPGISPEVPAGDMVESLPEVRPEGGGGNQRHCD